MLANSGRIRASSNSNPFSCKQQKVRTTRIFPWLLSNLGASLPVVVAGWRVCHLSRILQSDLCFREEHLKNDHIHTKYSHPHSPSALLTPVWHRLEVSRSSRCRLISSPGCNPWRDSQSSLVVLRLSPTRLSFWAFFMFQVLPAPPFPATSFVTSNTLTICS